MHRCADAAVDRARRRRRPTRSSRARAPGRADCASAPRRTRPPGTRAGATPSSPAACATSGASRIATSQTTKKTMPATPPPRSIVDRAARAAAPHHAAPRPVREQRHRADQRGDDRHQRERRGCGCGSSRARRRPAARRGRASRAGPRVTAIDACRRTASGRERVRVGVRHDVDLRPRQAGGDRHLVDDVLELAELQSRRRRPRRLELLDRLRAVRASTARSPRK